MISWTTLEDHLKLHYFYKLDNKAEKTIVLFGNCHLLPITYFLNRVLKNSYNFVVIISWFYEKFPLGELTTINEEIRSILLQADVFIYQKHNNSFGIRAHEITNYINDSCRLIHIPNFMLDYLLKKSTSSDMDVLKKEFTSSLFRLTESITKSDFPEYTFVIDNIYKVRFFNTIHHPTHFLLYLLSTSIHNVLTDDDPYKISIEDYYDIKIRNDFLNMDMKDFVMLPEKHDMDPIHHEITGFHYGADYFDINVLT